MATIWDVANLAGVSKSTVSLVVNRSPLVKETTRQKVQEAIRILDYVPNYNARSLTKRKNNSIGIIHMRRSTRAATQCYEWDCSIEQFFHDIEESVCSAVVDLNEDLSIVKEHLHSGTDAPAMAKIIRDRRVDGVIFVGGMDDAAELVQVQKVDIPVVLATSKLNLEGIDLVMHDPSGGTRLAVEKLIDTGHQRICLINCPQRFRIWPARIQGLHDAMAGKGKIQDPRLMVSVDQMNAHNAYDTFARVLDSGVKPDAVVTANPDLAMGVLHCLYDRRIRIPDDISVICYEDSGICGSMSPPLSAVNIRKEEMGRTALNFLLDRISHPETKHRKMTVEPYLVMRGSVKTR